MLFSEWIHGLHQIAKEVRDSRRVKKPCFRLYKNVGHVGSSLAVQWLRLHASTARGMGLIPGQGAKIPHTMWHGQLKKKKVQLPRVHHAVRKPKLVM